MMYDIIDFTPVQLSGPIQKKKQNNISSLLKIRLAAAGEKIFANKDSEISEAAKELYSDDPYTIEDRLASNYDVPIRDLSNYLSFSKQNTPEIDFTDYELQSMNNSNNITSNTTNASGNAKIAYNFLIDKGLKDYQAAAIVGNLIAESGNVNPNAWNPNDNGSPSGGIAQWHKGRLQKLKSLPNWKSLDTQLNFLWHELTTDYSGVLKSLKESKDLDEATFVFLNKYEVPQDRTYGGRNHRIRFKYGKSMLS